MEVIILKQTERELKTAPKRKKLSMPISRPLPAIGKGLHELRLSGRSGEYRVFYVVKVSDAIYVIHASSKKKMSLDRQTADLLKQRMKDLGI